MNKKLSDKNKKDWQSFISNKAKVLDKDLSVKEDKQIDLTKKIDLHGFSLEKANQVIDEFKEWRVSREKQSRIPDHLWKHVIPLLTDHPRSTVLGRLGISHGQLKKHLNRQNPKPKYKIEAQTSKPEGCDFIECKLP